MKKFIRGVASFLLGIGLLNLAIFTAVILVLGNPSEIKQALSESKIYSTIVDNIIDASQDAMKDRPNETGESFPIDQPEIRAAAQKAFPPEFLQQNAEQVLDSTYSWLDGKSDKPTFQIDLTQAKQTLANELGNYAFNRFNTLPVCTLQQLMEAGGEVDAFSASCRPPGLTAEVVKQDVINKFANSEEFLGDTVINADTLPKNEQGRSVFDQLAQAPDTLQKLRQAPWVLASVSLLLAAAVVFLHQTKRQGLRQVATVFVSIGVFLLIGTLLFTYLFNQMNSSGGSIAKSFEGEFQQAALAVISSLQSTANIYVLYFCAGYIGGGALVLALLHFTKPKNPVAPEQTIEKKHIAAPAITESKTEPTSDSSSDSKEEPTGPPPLKK